MLICRQVGCKKVHESAIGKRTLCETASQRRVKVGRGIVNIAVPPGEVCNRGDSPAIPENDFERKATGDSHIQ